MHSLYNLIILVGLIGLILFLKVNFKRLSGITYIVTACISFVIGIMIYRTYTYKIFWGEYRVSEEFFVQMMVVWGIILMVVAVALGGIGIVLLSAKFFKKDINTVKLFSENIKVRCTSCNELNFEDASFCSKCGAKLTK